MKLLVRSVTQIVQVCSKGEKCLKGPDLTSSFSVLKANETDGLLAIAVGDDGKIAAIGFENLVILQCGGLEVFDNVVDAKGKCIVPGLVDGHTHPVWAGDRVHEFAMKLAGATYLDIHKAGGGINFTVTKTREEDEDALLASFLKRISGMMRRGTTLVECKSGYGLEWETEWKMLRVLERAKSKTPVTISSTYCAAHSVPKGKTAAEATQDIVENQIPKLKQEIDSGRLNVDAIDVFCEKGVFEVEDSKKILQAGRDIGLRMNFHGDELHPLGGGEMGGEIGAEAISHLEQLSKAGIEKMAKSGTFGVLLPTTALALQLPHPPVRDMIKSGIPVALGSDFNPNAYCLSMPIVMHLACVMFRMSLPEAMAAATINAAGSLGKSDFYGSLEVGKFADMLILDTDNWENLIYRLGSEDDLIQMVIKAGNVVHGNPA